MQATANVSYWNQRAVSAVDSATATHPDRHQRRWELERVKAHWPKTPPRVLDVGCGAGWTESVIDAVSTEVIAIDRAQKMIDTAREAYPNLKNTRFELGDVLNLEQWWKFDLVISQRCLINLSGWEEQQQALDQIASVLNPGGLFIMQEGSMQGRAGLNALRERMGIGRMPDVVFNRDFDETLLMPVLLRKYRRVADERFGLYDLLSRVVNPLLAAPREPRYDDPINEVAIRIVTQDGVELPMPNISREFSLVLERK